MSRESELRTKRRQLAEAEAVDTDPPGSTRTTCAPPSSLGWGRRSPPRRAGS